MTDPEIYANMVSHSLAIGGDLNLKQAEIYAILALASAVDRIADALNQNARIGQDMSQHVLGALTALDRAETE